MPLQNRQTRPVAIVGGSRLPFCRMGTNYSEMRVVDLMSASLKGLVEKYDLKGQKIDDVFLGTVFDHPAVWNMAREAVLASGLAPETPAIGNQRACATSLDSTINIANKIALGQIEVGIAGGAEAMSDTAVFYRSGLSRRLVKSSQAKTFGQRLKIWSGLKFSDLKPATPPAVEASTGKTMGEHCEKMVKEWKITREEQDLIAYNSHKNAAAAYDKGFYKDLVIPFQGLSIDTFVRKDTSLEKLAKLKPAFDLSGQGTLTAGNSSPFTDGASSVLLCSEKWAKDHGLPIQAYITEYESAAIDLLNEGLLMAPAYAVPRMLKRENINLQDFDFYEIHEAFAGQVACALKAWETEKYCRERLKLPKALGSIDRNKMNTVGGSVALGHPFGATGARLVATLAKLLNKKGSGRGLISICAGGGMGTVAILEA
jgi:acetyl-CoA C-acetyltransferase